MPRITPIKDMASAKFELIASPRRETPVSTPGAELVFIEEPTAPRIRSTGTDIWHYTDAAGVIGILTSGTLRASSLSTMNDSAEYRYGRELVDELLHELNDSAFAHPLQKAYIGDVVKLSDWLVQRSGLFVACASMAAGSLAQWRAYGRGQGLALLLDPHAEIAVLGAETMDYSIDVVSHAWRQVLYDRGQQRELLLKTFGYLALRAPVEVSRPTMHESEEDRSSAMTIMSAIAYCKEPSFAEEQEVRLLCASPHDAAVHFKAGQVGITPFLQLTGCDDLKWCVDRPGLLPVTGVAVGPFPTREESAQSARLLLDLNGHRDVRVEVSSSTLR